MDRQYDPDRKRRDIRDSDRKRRDARDPDRKRRGEEQDHHPEIPPAVAHPSLRNLPVRCDHLGLAVTIGLKPSPPSPDPVQHGPPSWCRVAALGSSHDPRRSARLVARSIVRKRAQSSNDCLVQTFHDDL